MKHQIFSAPATLCHVTKEEYERIVLYNARGWERMELDENKKRLRVISDYSL